MAKHRQTIWDELVEVRKHIRILHADLDKSYKREGELKVALMRKLNGSTVDLLTPRQEQVLKLIATAPDISNKEIADKLFVSERTIKFHMSSLLMIFRVQNRQQLRMSFVNTMGGENEIAN